MPSNPASDTKFTYFISNPPTTVTHMVSDPRPEHIQ